MTLKRKTLWLTRTALMLALLIALQAVTKPLGQLVTGSCVNGILAMSSLLCGTASGLTVALLSPVCAYLLGIAPQILTVPAIMVGNSVLVLLMGLLARKWKTILSRILLWLVPSGAKAAVLYGLVKGILCGLAAPLLTGKGLLSQAMLAALPTQFAWPQLVTALIGSGVAILLAPAVEKAVRKERT